MRKALAVAAVAAAAVVTFLLARPAPPAGGKGGAAGGSAAPRSDGRSGGATGARGGRAAGAARGAAGASGGADAADAAPGSTPPVDAPATAQDGFIELKISAAGRPVAGAVVRLYLRGPVDPNTSLTDWRLAGAGPTGAEGVLRLPARPGTYLAAARAPGFAPGFRELRRLLGEPVTRAALELQAGASLTGRAVARGSGEPVPLAALALTAQARARGPFGFGQRADTPAEEQVRAAADTRGAFRVDGLAPGEWRVEARAPGFGRGVETEVRVPRRAELVLELPAASFIEGHVLAADGSPAAGAEVVATGGPEPSIAIASDRGAFSLEVEPRAWSLSARRGSEAGALDRTVAVAAGQTASGIELRLGKACAIAGSVVAATGGRPLAGARISVSPWQSEGDSGRALTGPDGSFAVEGLAPGAYDVAVDLDGFLSELRRGVTVQQGQRFPLRVELRGTGRVEGLVLDSHSAPVEGATVTTGRGLGPQAAGAQDAPEARTGPDGRYLLAAVPAGRVQLVARRDGSLLGPQQMAEVREGEAARADFTLADDGVLTGRVSRAGGPLPDQVTVRAVRAQLSISTMDFAATQADAQGNYRLQLPPGSYRVTADAGGARPSIGPLRDAVAIEPNKTLVKDLVLPEEGQDQTTLTITVLEPGGAPSAGATVVVSSAEAGVRFMMVSNADEQGRFQLQRAKGDLPDAFDLRATNGGRAGAAKATREQAQVTVQLLPGGRVEGRLAGAAPDGTFTVSVASPADGGLRLPGGLAREFTGDRFVLDDVAVGPEQVAVKTADGRSGRATAQVQSGQTAQLEIALEQAPGVSGRVVDEAGKPVPDVLLMVDGGSAGQRSGGDGRFLLSDLAPGDHALSGFLPPLRHLAEKRFTLQAGQRFDLGDVVMQTPKADPGTVGVMLRGDSEAVTVVGMIPGSPAEQAGVAVGDVLAFIDGGKVTGADDARVRLKGAPGSTVTLTVVRNGTSRVIPVVRAG